MSIYTIKFRKAKEGAKTVYGNIQDTETGKDTVFKIPCSLYSPEVKVRANGQLGINLKLSNKSKATIESVESLVNKDPHGKGMKPFETLFNGGWYLTLKQQDGEWDFLTIPECGPADPVFPGNKCTITCTATAGYNSEKNTKSVYWNIKQIEFSN